MNDWHQTLSSGTLLLIAAAAIALILLMIIRWRVHALLTLTVVSLLTALATGIPAQAIVNDVLLKNLGSTLGGVAILVSLGAMLGRLVETSGGAQSLADAMIRTFGEKRAPFALGVASLLFGFPIFFDAGLVVMLPIVFAVARRMKSTVLAYALPSIGAFSVMHVFLYAWGLAADKMFPISVPDLLAGGKQDNDQPQAPASAGLVVSLMMIPMLLIFLNTGLHMASASGWVDGKSSAVQFLRMVGSTPVALLISVLAAMYFLGTKRGMNGSALEKTLDSTLGPVCSVILITGAGGMFGGVLRASGIGDALKDSMAHLGVPVLLGCFLVALALRIAQGSATVALTTAAGLMANAVAAAGYNDWQLAGVVLATAAGSVAASHVNDSGFWLVGRLLNLDVATTLKTWTVNQTLIALIGFALSAGAVALLG